eukprot:g2752.t1
MASVVKKGGKKGKKGSDVSRRVILGRPGNNLKVGIVGLPNVGKSSFFNVLCKMDVAAENFAFCTIEPTQSTVPVPDKRLKKLVKEFKPKKEIPAVLTVMDIAGLIEGASKGEGLGNEFLSNIARTDCIYHMVRAFPNKEVSHVCESVDPVRDMQIIHNELILKDLDQAVKSEEKLAKDVARAGSKVDKRMKTKLETIQKAIELLKAGKDIRGADWSQNEVVALNEEAYLSAKPMIYLVNVSKKSMKQGGNVWFEKIQEFIKKRGNGEKALPFSVSFEEEYKDLIDAGQADKVEKGLKSQLPKIIKTAYKTLDLINFFTCGPDEVRAWTIRKGWLAPQAAGTIHTDFEKHFVKIEKYNYSEFEEFGTEKKVKEAGKYVLKGKDYVMEDGDIILVKHNARK